MVDIEWRLESIGTFLQGKEKNPDSVAEVQIRFGTVVVALQSNTRCIHRREIFSPRFIQGHRQRIPIKTESSS